MINEIVKAIQRRNSMDANIIAMRNAEISDTWCALETLSRRNVVVVINDPSTRKKIPKNRMKKNLELYEERTLMEATIAARRERPAVTIPKLAIFSFVPLIEVVVATITIERKMVVIRRRPTQFLLIHRRLLHQPESCSSLTWTVVYPD